MKNYGFWICIIILLWVTYSQNSEINELSGLVGAYKETATEQAELVTMQRDYINIECSK